MAPSARLIIFFLFSFLFAVKSVHAQVVINEFMPDAETEWVEFHNASSSAEYIKAYYLQDKAGNKVTLENLNVINPSFPYVEFKKTLNNDGDEFFLYKDLELIDSASYSKNPGDNTSIGKSPDKDGNFYILESPSKGAPNSAKKATPAPTPTPTPEPTQPPSPSPTPTPTKSPSPSPKKTTNPDPTRTPEPIDLSKAREALQTPGPEEVLGTDTEVREKPKMLSIIFIGAGTAFMGAAGYPFAKKEWEKRKLKKYNKTLDE